MESELRAEVAHLRRTLLTERQLRAALEAENRGLRKDQLKRTLAAQPSVAAMVYHTALSHVAALGRYVSTRIVLLKAAVTEFWWAEDPEMADNPELLEVSKKEF